MTLVSFTPSWRSEGLFLPSANALVRGVSLEKSPAPTGLRKRGKSLWHNVIEVGEPNPAELEILHELCSVMDEIDVLKAVLRRSTPMVQGSTGQPRPNPIYGGCAGNGSWPTDWRARWPCRARLRARGGHEATTPGARGVHVPSVCALAHPREALGAAPRVLPRRAPEPYPRREHV